MRLAVYGPFRVGLVLENDKTIVDLQQATAAYLASKGESRPYDLAEGLVGHELGAFIRGGDDALQYARKVRDFAAKDLKGLAGPEGEKIVHRMSEVRLRPPVTQDYRFKVICIGANFADHLQGMELENGKRVTKERARTRELSQTQWGFYKSGANLATSGDDVPYPARCDFLDYEGEIALILGKAGKDIKNSKLLDHVFGVALFDDFSIRGSQVRFGPAKGALQVAKNFECSGALGPIVVTKDDIPDPRDVDFTTTVSGEVRQRGNTKDMVRDFGNWLEYISQDVIANPGDIITSGTCAGTAADTSERDPKRAYKSDARFLKVGDTVTVGSKRIGSSLTNKVVAK